MQTASVTCQESIFFATAKDEVTRLGAQVSIAAVDEGGNLVAFLRMDGAEIAGPSLAVHKAYTVC